MARYRFSAGGDACGICSGLDGTSASPPAHDNCRCQSVPDDEDECTWEFQGSSTRSGGRVTFGAEVTVTCPDGSPVGQSVPVDVTGHAGLDENVFDYIRDQLQAVADELCEDCPEDEPDLVS